MTDPFRLERQAIRASFERASGTYDEAAILQARVRQELIERLALLQLSPGVILDLGSGTGRAAPSLALRYPDAFIAALDLAPSMLRKAAAHAAVVCADAARLPFAAHSLDLVFSNLMLQWCEEPDVVFDEVRRCLKPGGFFAFTTFGPDTLHELRAAWSAADGFSHVHRFIDMHDIGDALVRAGFSEPVMDVERVRLTYADAVALMRDLKAIGAHNVTSGRARGLTSRARFARMTAAYDARREDGRLPATYEVIYGAAWGAGERDAAPAIGGEARIPIGSIRRRRP